MNDLPSIYIETIPYSQRRPLPPTPPPIIYKDTNTRNRESLFDTSITDQFDKFQIYVCNTLRSIERQIDGLDIRIRMIEYQLVNDSPELEQCNTE